MASQAQRGAGRARGERRARKTARPTIITILSADSMFWARAPERTPR